MKFIKYYTLLLAYSIFKKISTSKEYDFKDASPLFPAKYQNKWYVKYAAILSCLSLFGLIPLILLLLYIEHILNAPSWINIPNDIIISILFVLSFGACIYTYFFGVVSYFIKEYLSWHIKKKHASDINSYVSSMDNAIKNLEHYNIEKEKQRLEEVLTISHSSNETPKKRIKI